MDTNRFEICWHQPDYC